MLSSNMLLQNLILLIDVTFSTPTPDFVNNLAKPLLLQPSDGGRRQKATWD